MQDNPYRSDIDDAFEDKAWMDMEAILDEEMPVRKRKRRLLVWWFFGGFLLVLFGLFTWWFTSSNQLAEKYAALKETETDNSTISSKQEEEITFQPTTSEPITPTKKEKQNIDSKTSNNNNILVHTPKFSTSSSPIKEHNTKLSSGMVTEFVADSFVLVDITRPINSVHPEFSSSKSKSTLAIAPTLFVKPWNLLPIPNREIYFNTPSIIEKVTFFPTWSWGIHGSVGTFKMTRLNALGFGGFAQYDFKEKWNFQFGLAYHYVKMNLVSNNLQNTGFADDQAFPSPEDMDDIEATTDQEDNKAGTTLDPIELPVNTDIRNTGTIQYISIPLLLEYRYRTKWSGYFGTSIYYGFSDSFNSLDANQMKLRRWDVSSSIGIGYHFKEDVGVRLGYDLGWFQKRKVLSDQQNFFPSVAKRYSPLEGRFLLSGYYKF